MEKETIYQRLMEMRRSRPLTNVYTTDVVERATDLWMEEDGFLFSYEDHGISRLAYCVTSLDVLLRLIRKVQSGTHYMEFMTAEDLDFAPDLELVTRLKRLANADCRTVFDDPVLCRFRDEAIGEIARPSDAHEINQILWAVFHTEISHLLWDDEIEERIGKGMFTVHRADEIDAVLMADVMPKKFYINQIVNRGDRRNIHAMLLNRLWDYVQGGGKYLYAWVEEGNIASIKFHGKYGMRHDGMWSVLWRLKR